MFFVNWRTSSVIYPYLILRISNLPLQNGGKIEGWLEMTFSPKFERWRYGVRVREALRKAALMFTRDSFISKWDTFLMCFVGEEMQLHTKTTQLHFNIIFAMLYVLLQFEYKFPLEESW